jgi:hypothetical protein
VVPVALGAPSAASLLGRPVVVGPPIQPAAPPAASPTAAGTEIIWSIDGTLPGRVSRDDLESVGARMLELLAAFDKPARIEAEVGEGLMAMSRSGSKKVQIPSRVVNNHGDALHPRRLLNVAAHELTHPILRESLARRVPQAVALIENPPFVKEIQELLSSIDRPGVDVQAAMARLHLLGIEQKRVLWKGNLYKGYTELLADLVAVAALRDPRAIYKTMSSPKKSKVLYLIAERYRRFDRRFTKARIVRWRRDMKRYDALLNKGGTPDPYLLFAPARAWLWELLRGSIETQDPRLPLLLKALLEASAEETLRGFAELDAGGTPDPLALNESLLATFRARAGL